MSNTTAPKSPRYRGWFFDQLSGVLEAFHGTTRVLGATASAITFDLATTISAALSSTASITAHSGTAVPAGGTAGAGFLVSSTANLGVFFGSGAPTLSAAQGSLYIRTDGSSTSTRLYVNTNGTTGWTNVTTAA